MATNTVVKRIRAHYPLTGQAHQSFRMDAKKRSAFFGVDVGFRIRTGLDVLDETACTSARAVESFWGLGRNRAPLMIGAGREAVAECCHRFFLIHLKADFCVGPHLITVHAFGRHQSPSRISRCLELLVESHRSLR